MIPWHCSCERFEYVHIELQTHDLLLAEGAPAESYLPQAERVAFDNTADRPRHDGSEMPYPRIKSHRQVPPTLHACLAARAAALRSAASRAA